MYLNIGSKGDLVQEVQSKLTELGFDPGLIDGVYGQKTRNAVVRFQESKGLVITSYSIHYTKLYETSL